MNLSEAIEYFRICQLADGYSPSTVELYQWALSRLLGFAGDQPAAEITLKQLRRFMLYMKNEYEPRRPGGNSSPLSPSSLQNIWKALRSFFGWAEQELGIERPDERLGKPPSPPAEIEPFTHHEIQLLVSACERTRLSSGRRKPFTMKRPTGVRDKAIVLTLLDTGLRVGELARLKVDNLQLDRGKIYVEPWGSGKKTKSRNVYLGKASTRAIYRYLIERKEETQDHLFINSRGREMNRNTIRHILNALGERAGVPKVYPHRFRHTFAIQYLRNGGDVFTLQHLLGHSSLEMVRRYLHLADRDVAGVHRTASPVDRWQL